MQGTKILCLWLGCLLVCVAPLSAQTDTLTVLFETGEAHLSPEAQAQLTSLAERLDTMYKATYLLKGYTDDIGSSASNKKLAQSRIESVGRWLLIRGAKESQLEETLAIGELALGAATDTTAVRQSNRRVDVIYTFVEEPSEVDLLMDAAEAGQTVTLPNVLFVGGESTVKPESYSTVRNLRDYLKLNPSVKVHFIGHICCQDPDGPDGVDLVTGEHNLSEARARRIVRFLVNQGIDPSRLSAEGRRCSEPTGNGAAADRRVEIKILQK